MQVATTRPTNARNGSAHDSHGGERSPGVPGERHQNEGHGRRLTQAFEALDGFPAL